MDYPQMFGELVRYRGWLKTEGPLGIVVDESSAESKHHHRIRVLWTGEEVPIQASVLSVDGARITTWVSPEHFEIIGE